MLNQHSKLFLQQCKPVANIIFTLIKKALASDGLSGPGSINQLPRVPWQGDQRILRGPKSWSSSLVPPKLGGPNGWGDQNAKANKHMYIWGDKKIKCLLKTQIEVHCEIILSCVDYLLLSSELSESYVLERLQAWGSRLAWGGQRGTFHQEKFQSKELACIQGCRLKT